MKKFSKKESNIICHAELDSASCERFRIKSGMTEESGRSMVEMLGVLAVMGVLSVGGVAMYTSAMNKHRANEILNEASKRAVMVAGQLLTNPSATTMSLAQFGSNAVAGGTFGENAAIANGKITLTVSGVETAVCNQMKAATGDNAVMTVTGDCGSTLTLTFNTDMSKGGNSDDSTSTIEACDTDNPCVDECQECVSGHCQDKCTDGKICIPNNIVTQKICTDKPSDCSSCGSNQYCVVSSSDEFCEQADRGTCVNIESDEAFEAKKVTITFEDGTTLNVYKEGGMTWITNKNWCEAHGKQMVSLADLKCTPSGCSDWNALHTLGSNVFWTKNSKSSCDYYVVRTHMDAIDYFGWYAFSSSGLCK